jgi:hypothetical protein
MAIKALNNILLDLPVHLDIFAIIAFVLPYICIARFHATAPAIFSVPSPSLHCRVADTVEGRKRS